VLLAQLASLLLPDARSRLARKVAQDSRLAREAREHHAITAAPADDRPPLDPLERHTPANRRCVASGSAPVKSGLRLALRATADAALLTGGCASGYGAIRSRTQSSPTATEWPATLIAS
jgi:hypothetical protein